ncbi:hypothetical protein V7793_10780 [Streptomyces sp. KLMMK]|uniref:hypothetical protein n=1 Tax=Streptomyces sp. KLMMK TaxID=3109353 RepID=UPI00300956DB
MVRSEIDAELRSAIEDVHSTSWAVRAAAGRRLAAAADVAQAADALYRLLLDQDTGVTQETAEALLERWDVCGWRLVLAALVGADDVGTADQLQAGIDVVCYGSLANLTRFRVLCAALMSDADESISEEASSLLSRWQQPDQ